MGRGKLSKGLVASKHGLLQYFFKGSEVMMLVTTWSPSNGEVSCELCAQLLSYFHCDFSALYCGCVSDKKLKQQLFRNGEGICRNLRSSRYGPPQLFKEYALSDHLRDPEVSFVFQLRRKKREAKKRKSEKIFSVSVGCFLPCYLFSLVQSFHLTRLTYVKLSTK